MMTPKQAHEYRESLLNPIQRSPEYNARVIGLCLHLIDEWDGGVEKNDSIIDGDNGIWPVVLETDVSSCPCPECGEPLMNEWETVLQIEKTSVNMWRDGEWIDSDDDEDRADEIERTWKGFVCHTGCQHNMEEWLNIWHANIISLLPDCDEVIEMLRDDV